MLRYKRCGKVLQPVENSTEVLFKNLKGGEIMSGKKKPKKQVKARPTAHEVAITLLKENPDLHIGTIARMYGYETEVPKEAIPGLIEALERADTQVSFNVVYFQDAIDALKKQQKEPKK